MNVFIILRTRLGQAYGSRIRAELKSLAPAVRVPILYRDELRRFLEQHPACTPSNTLIHARVAHPDEPWMQELVEVEGRGFRVVNRTDSLRLSCDNYRCSKAFERNGLACVPTWRLTNDGLAPGSIRTTFQCRGVPLLVVKPRTSKGQGRNVHLLDHGMSDEHIAGILSSIPITELVVQEFVPCTSLYRIVVLDGDPLPVGFVDRPGNGSWKASVCLNSTSMKLVRNPPDALLDFAVQVQRAVGGEISFVDVFDTPGGYVLSEVNVACNFLIHERLAGTAGHSYWNIARSIAASLLSEDNLRTTAVSGLAIDPGQHAVAAGEFQ